MAAGLTSSALGATQPFESLFARPSAGAAWGARGAPLREYYVELRTEVSRTNTTDLSLEAGNVIFDMLADPLSDLFPGGHPNAGPAEVDESTEPGAPGFVRVTIFIDATGPNESLFDVTGGSAIFHISGLDLTDILNAPPGSPIILAPGATFDYAGNSTLPGEPPFSVSAPADTRFTIIDGTSLNFDFSINTGTVLRIRQAELTFEVMVPEPSTLVLVLAGAWMVRRRRT